MKAIRTLFTLTAPLLFLACQDVKENGQEPISEKVLYAHVGEEIPVATAMEWIDQYEKKMSSAGSRAVTEGTNTLSSEAMEDLLGSVSELIGLAFHYAIDGDGTEHILAIPIDGNMQLWSDDTKRMLIDTKSGTPIDEEQARAWASNYRDAHPDGVWYHFFGKTIFDQMRALPHFSRVEIRRGIHTQELTPEMLLMIWNEEGSSSGRTKNIPATAYDASNPCPPCTLTDPAYTP